MPGGSTLKSNQHPLTGAYYWIPVPRPDGFDWELRTCHDLKRWDGISHREFWPSILEQLAPAWGFVPDAFLDLLSDNYYALPRGRITKPKGNYMILQGDDAPLRNWKTIVIDRFLLRSLHVKILYDEHERVLSDDVLALEIALGINLNLPGM